ncbi:MAG TPA: energy transducer TonB, partial [Sphingomonas sp.]
MNRDRAISAVGAAALQGLIGWALLSGLAASFGRAPDEALEVFAVAPEPPPPPPERVVPNPKRSEKREGRAAPPNRVSRATPVVAPTPVVVPPVPSPVVAAPVANTGAEATQGAALPGPGTGAGGVGDGTGSGGEGDGGGSGGLGRDIRLISGRVRMDDLPGRLFDQLMDDPTDRIVSLRFLVGVKGRVTACEITRSSGIRALDEATCDLIRRKLRYRPALDARGRPYPVEVTGEHEWLFRD